jgi:hypothetical protein
MATDALTQGKATPSLVRDCPSTPGRPWGFISFTRSRLPLSLHKWPERL